MAKLRPHAGILSRRLKHAAILGALYHLLVAAALAQPKQGDLGDLGLPGLMDLEDAARDDLKAAFLENFANYVEWPERAFEKSGGTLVVCVLGADGVATSLAKRVAWMTEEERPFEVRKRPPPDRLGDCHLLFIGAPATRKWRQIAASVREKSILTVGDGEEFFETGGMIAFAAAEGKLRFEVNYDAAQRAGLKMSSQLLKLARRVIAHGIPGTS